MGFNDIKYENPVYQCKIHKYTNRKCLKDPTCAIFLNSWWFNDVKNYITKCSIYKYSNTNTNTNTNINVYINTACDEVPKRPNICQIFE